MNLIKSRLQKVMCIIEEWLKILHTCPYFWSHRRQIALTARLNASSWENIYFFHSGRPIFLALLATSYNHNPSECHQSDKKKKLMVIVSGCFLDKVIDSTRLYLVNKWERKIYVHINSLCCTIRQFEQLRKEQTKTKIVEEIHTKTRLCMSAWTSSPRISLTTTSKT